MSELLVGIGILILYFVICAAVALTFRKLIKIPDELFRKILHLILLFSLLVFVYGFKKWWHASIVCLGFIIIVYPILFFFEHFKSYSKLVTERKKGELKSSLIIVFLMFAAVISVCWGCFNDKLLTLAVVYSWGFGDAAAALIGTKFGKYKIYKKKTLEGTFAMFLTASFSILVILLIRGMLLWYGYLVVVIVTAFVVTIVELYTPNGLDTITCPFSSLGVMIFLLYLFGGLM